MSKIQNKIHKVTSKEMKEIEKVLAKMEYLKICRIDTIKTNSCEDLYKEMAKSFNFNYSENVQYYLENLDEIYDEMNLNKQGFAVIVYNYEKSKKFPYCKNYDREEFEKMMQIMCEEYLIDCINCKGELVEIFFNVYLVD